MRIAFITSHVYPFRKGGTEKRIHEIGSRLAKEGHHVTVYGCKWWSGSPEIQHEGMTLRGVCEPGEQYTNGRRSITEALRFSVSLLAPLVNHRNDHDILLACVSEHFPVWTAALASAVGSADLVTTWHEVWDYDYWQEYLGSMGAIGWLVQLVTANLPQRSVAVSELTADRLADLSNGRNRAKVVGNGVDIKRIRSTTPASEGHDILFVGRLIPEKNVDILLSAFDRVAEDHDLTLGIIGEGPEKEALVEQAEAMTHGDRVSFLGFLEEDRDVYAQMAAADVFVLPSAREGFGITVLEAMATGCVPVVASHSNSAATEVVESAGILADPDPSALADSIERAVGDASLIGDPVERAREFHWDRVVEEAAEVYREVNGDATVDPVRIEAGDRTPAVGQSPDGWNHHEEDQVEAKD